MIPMQKYVVYRNGVGMEKLDVEILLEAAHAKSVKAAGSSIAKFNSEWKAAVDEIATGFGVSDRGQVRTHAMFFAEYMKDSRGYGFVLPIAHEDARELYRAAEGLWSSMVGKRSLALVDDLTTLDRDKVAERLETLRRAMCKVLQ